MTHMLQRAFLLGLISHVLAFGALFVLMSSHFSGGPQTVGSFLATGLGLGLLAFWSARRGLDQGHRGLLVARIVIVLGGLGSMLLWDSDQRMYLIGIFGLLLLFLLRRIMQMLEDLSYIRRALYEQFQADMRLLLVFGILAVVIPKDSQWQYIAVPLILSFVLARMFALSVASQMTKQVENSPRAVTLAEKWQGKTPLLLAGVALLGGWVLSVVGVPLLKLLDWLLTPVFYLLGWVMQLFMNAGGDNLVGLVHAISDFLMRILMYIFCLFGNCDFDGPLEVFNPDPLDDTGGAAFKWTLLVGVLTVILVAFTLYRMFRNRRGAIVRTVDGVVEIREFITQDVDKGHSRFLVGFAARTRMRKMYRTFLLRMKRQGRVRYQGETALEYIERITADHPQKKRMLQELTDYYMQERYGGKKVDDKLDRAEQLTADLKDL